MTRPDLDTWLAEKPRTVTEIVERIHETIDELLRVAAADREQREENRS